MDQKTRRAIDGGNLPVDTHHDNVFSAKESLFKAMNQLVGTFFDFSAMRAIRADDNAVVFSVAEPLSERFQVGVEIPVNYWAFESEVVALACIMR